MVFTKEWLGVFWILVAGLVLTAAPVFCQSMPHGFVLEEIATSGLNGPPVGFDFLPDGRIILVQRNPYEVLVSPVGSTAAVVIGTITGVSMGSSEEGLLGVAVDPGWPERPYLYFHYTHVSAHIYVTMYTVTGDLTDPAGTNLALVDRYFLLTDVPNVTVRHSGGTVRFGPDGMLYVSLGDDLRDCDTAQDLTVLGGGILRLDVTNMPGSGLGPPPKADITPVDNPFPGPDENQRLAYLWGLRNPFRFTFDPLTGDLFLADVGANQFEEIDIAYSAEGGGGNYGWPEWEAFRSTGIDCDVTYPFIDPVYFYGHDQGGEAVIGGPLYRLAGTDAFPTEYDGSYFFAENTHGWLRRIEAGPTGWEVAPVVSGQPSAENWGEDLGSLTDIQQGPDGSIYFCRIWGARGIHRIRYEDPTGVEAERMVPVASGLRVMPNPAGTITGTRVAWESARGSRVSLGIFDVSGRLVRRLLDQGLIDGPGLLHWDGRTDGGFPVPSGIYFVRLEDSTGRVAQEKVLMIR